VSAVAAAPARSGSPESYAAQLYETHRRAIFGLCYKQLRRREDADDAVQTTFVYALMSLRRGVEPELELPWLFTIAQNVCSTRRRNGMRRGAHESPQDLDSVQDRLASPERSDAATTDDFTAVLRAIPENQRRVLLLREWRGLSYDEIGSELGLSQSATEALLFRARRNVAQRLGERTGLRAALQGLPSLSFLRNLFRSAAAKTIAVGAGAALTVAAVPASHDEVQFTRPIRAPVVAPVHPTVVPSAPSRVRRPTHRVRAAVTRSVSHDVAPRPRGRSLETKTSQGTAPSSPAPTGTTTPPPSDVSSPAAVTLPAVKTVVETASDVGASLDVPEVSLPGVQTPAVSLPQVEVGDRKISLPVAPLFVST
jgi:RNA polymerase sigma factor (sigma-70 family)